MQAMQSQITKSVIQNSACIKQVGETLRNRCRSFPGMVNNTVIDWFEPWPEQALHTVASVFLEQEDLPAALRPAIVTHMVLVHQSVRTFSTKFFEELRRHNYVTPKNYLDFINNYKKSLADNRKMYSDMASRLNGGLQKLIQATKEVDSMQKELNEATVVVEKATKECNELLEVYKLRGGCTSSGMITRDLYNSRYCIVR